MEGIKFLLTIKNFYKLINSFFFPSERSTKPRILFHLTVKCPVIKPFCWRDKLSTSLIFYFLDYCFCMTSKTPYAPRLSFNTVNKFWYFVIGILSKTKLLLVNNTITADFQHFQGYYIIHCTILMLERILLKIITIAIYLSYYVLLLFKYRNYVY